MRSLWWLPTLDSWLRLYEYKWRMLLQLYCDSMQLYDSGERPFSLEQCSGEVDLIAFLHLEHASRRAYMCCMTQQTACRLLYSNASFWSSRFTPTEPLPI
jgi:hypothetical protein